MSAPDLSFCRRRTVPVVLEAKVVNVFPELFAPLGREVGRRCALRTFELDQVHEFRTQELAPVLVYVHLFSMLDMFSSSGCVCS
eukprot:466811-Rhodomonas_salina.3